MKQFQICVSGGAAGPHAVKAYDLARKVGEAVAKNGHVLITGATTGVPYEAAKAAKKAKAKKAASKKAAAEKKAEEAAPADAPAK